MIISSHIFASSEPLPCTAGDPEIFKWKQTRVHARMHPHPFTPDHILTASSDFADLGTGQELSSKHDRKINIAHSRMENEGQ